MNDYLNNQNNQTNENHIPGAQPTTPAQEQPAQKHPGNFQAQQSWNNTGSWSNTAQPQTQTGSFQTQQNPSAYSAWGQAYSPYQTQAQPAVKPKKNKTGISTALIAVLLVACLLIGAGAGVGGALLVSGMRDTADVGTPLDNTNPNNENPPALSAPDGGNATIQKSEGTKVIVQRTGVGSADGTVTSLAEVVEKIKASVVEITTETVVSGSRFNQYVTSGAGSGVIIAKEGYIITNHHVISGANNITVRTIDGTEFSASLIGTDAASDIAVLKIDPKDTVLTVAVLGNSSNLVVGEDAIAIGNPLGELGGTVTNGIISALDREVEIDGESMRLLQTNAAVNPGNSGGGLFNLAGELIGIVNAKSSGSDVEGLGFAIPVNTAQDVATQLIEYGYVRGRVDIGLNMIDITSMFDLMAYRLSTPGVYVYESPYNNEIKSGDRIQSVNGVSVSSTAEVKAAYRDCAVGDVIVVSVVRNNRVIDVNVTLRELVPSSTGVQFGD
ncbi:MAG: trypsin-like peptidase domain-containing protein [Clostridia bacterium]|nr:trypsin-like peptidase domain-containing protein [Clostridia bacterium]